MASDRCGTAGSLPPGTTMPASGCRCGKAERLRKTRSGSARRDFEPLAPNGLKLDQSVLPGQEIVWAGKGTATYGINHVKSGDDSGAAQQVSIFRGCLRRGPVGSCRPVLVTGLCQGENFADRHPAGSGAGPSEGQFRPAASISNRGRVVRNANFGGHAPRASDSCGERLLPGPVWIAPRRRQA
jgi:hypothetical protein